MSAEPAVADLAGSAERAARLHAAVRGFECLCAAAFAGAAAAAAAVASGAGAGASLNIAAAIAAVCAGLALWRERPPRRADLERAADVRAGLGGALATVLDGARAGAQPGLLAILARRLPRARSRNALWRAALPSTPLALAGPLLGLALLSLASELRPPTAPGGRAAAHAAAELLGASAAARSRGDAALARELEIAARRVEMAAADPRIDAAGARAELAADVRRLGATLPAGDPAGDALRAALRALDPDASGAGGAEPRTGRDTRSGPAPAAGSPDAAAAPDGTPGTGSRGASGRGVLASAAPDGRMVRPTDVGDPRQTPDTGLATGGGTAPEAGLAARDLRWWPTRYDAVVERWLAP